jgi:hypothetical protein
MCSHTIDQASRLAEHPAGDEEKIFKYLGRRLVGEDVFA